MKIDPNKIQAVLTGDVVGSSALPAAARRRLPETLRRAGEAVRATHGAVIPRPLDVFRGDGWQWLVTEPAAAVEVAVLLQAELKAAPDGLTTRVAVGLGRLEFVPAGRVSTGNGEAYQLSGRGLEALPADVRLAVFPEEADAARTTIVRLLDALARRWTPAQARAVAGAIRGWSQAEIGAAWTPEVSQQAVGKHLVRAAWPALADGLLWVKNNLRGL